MRALRRENGCWAGDFEAMASPCRVLLDGSHAEARRALDAAAGEALRIERKFSRYRSDSMVQRINTAGGAPVSVDEEMARLLTFADQCHRMSEGLFDVTSGVLRRAWRFDGSDRVPSQSQVEALRPLVGWEKARWDPPQFTLPAGMEIDLGGIGKEYAVDRIAALLEEGGTGSALVNLGGDLRAIGRRPGGAPWIVGIEDFGSEGNALRRLQLPSGALATSGDARRFLLKDGTRYGHILDPRTGWPVMGAPRSVTVLGPTCAAAGLVATLAILQGSGAERFLQSQGVTHWCFR